MAKTQHHPTTINAIAQAIQAQPQSSTHASPPSADEAQSASERIRLLRKNAFITLNVELVVGSLQARHLASGARVFYWRYTHNGKTSRDLIGVYDSTRPPRSLDASPSGGWSIRAAVQEATSRAQQHLNNFKSGGYPSIVQAREKEKSDAKQESYPKATFGDLLDQYVDALKGNGKTSWKEVRNALERHVLKTWPNLMKKAAGSVTTDEVVAVIRKIHQAGKRRQGNKIRSYLRTAFENAKTSHNNPAAEETLEVFGISQNPVAQVHANTQFNKADKDPLDPFELTAYWRIIKQLPGVKGVALRLHLLSGAPRISQLVRLNTADISQEAFRLEDRKGRPCGQAREHIVPLTKFTQTLLNDLSLCGKHALSTDGGKTHIANTTLSGWAKNAVGDQIRDFKLKRVRSGVETLLARHKVDDKTRGRLQSHGVSGVQDKHYNAYEYFDEKRSALMLLHSLLEPKKPKRKRINEQINRSQKVMSTGG